MQRASPAATCRHCHRKPVNRPRGLCWSCYYTPGVRDQYAITSKYARRGPGVSNVATLPLGTPTGHAPGSAGKMAILQARLARGEELFHPLDAGMGGRRFRGRSIRQDEYEEFAPDGSSAVLSLHDD